MDVLGFSAGGHTAVALDQLTVDGGDLRAMHATVPQLLRFLKD
ncbi:hypothetical protein [uncultured Arthrobacter sp.]